MQPLQERQAIFFGFLAVQVIKIAQLIQVAYQEKEMNLNHLLIWNLMDTIYFILLRFLAKRKLKVMASILICIAFYGLNTAVISLMQPNTPDEVDEATMQIMNEHILGSHTVNT
jgi:hypothetical protein